MLEVESLRIGWICNVPNPSTRTFVFAEQHILIGVLSAVVVLIVLASVLAVYYKRYMHATKI